MSICVHKDEPSFRGGRGLLNQGNQRNKDRAYKSTKEQLDLSNPREKVWIWRVLVDGASRGWWTRVRAIDKFMEVLADEDSFNLKLSGGVVC